jgi:branched-chain amino acid transport system permease protein
MGKTDIITGTRQPWQDKLVRYAPYIFIGVILIVVPPFISLYVRSMMAKILIYAIFAMSLNLVFGYAGLLSLAHAAFFGAGGYTVGILMVRLGIESFWLVAPAGILMAALVAAVFGVIALQVRGVYFLVVTLALGELIANIAIRWRPVTGGSNGIIGISPYPILNIPGLVMTSMSFYYFVFIIFIICLFLFYRIANSPFGLALQGIRDDEGRMAHLGYNTWLYKYLIFIVAGAFAGVAGVLFGHHTGVVVPMHLGVMTSTMVMLMVIIGSTQIIWGSAVGAAVVVLLEHISSLYVPQRWPLIMGGVFVLAVMFLRGGITVHLVSLWKRVLYRYGSA